MQLVDRLEKLGKPRLRFGREEFKRYARLAEAKNLVDPHDVNLLPDRVPGQLSLMPIAECQLPNDRRRGMSVFHLAFGNRHSAISLGDPPSSGLQSFFFQ